ncbi:hypothetical protein BM221_001476 [Beauveria bassiana]|uniref:Protein kinase domain-containing protein n=1 Tax=Beauveria bassiana TaxID=176275 RepID=A0A2N6NVV2_BEABA|nr:hypothetical protein BM221_001476 [Beauveria bassiana]
MSDAWYVPFWQKNIFLEAEYHGIERQLKRKIWDILEGKQLFYAVDPEHKAYRRRAHLAEITALLGPPPKHLLTRGRLASKFFSEQADTAELLGTYAAGIDLPTSTSLEEQETLLTGDDKKKFLEFMRKMLQWSPERRSTARELFQDAWLQERSRSPSL